MLCREMYRTNVHRVASTCRECPSPVHTQRGGVNALVVSGNDAIDALLPALAVCKKKRKSARLWIFKKFFGYAFELVTQR